MLRYGIHDYEPRWLNGITAVQREHGERLAGLVTRTLRHVWVLWDFRYGNWFVDAPVLLDFGSEQLEIDHQKFDDLSITWNTIDPARAVDDEWSGLAWRCEAMPELEDLPGRVLTGVELLEWAGNPRDFAYGSVALGFDFAARWLTIFNALDENGMTHEAPRKVYRRHRVAVERSGRMD